ncbi:MULTISPECIES: ABC transporter permease [Pseudoalteromonas]|uniref:ABC transporter permease subunit n=1 Tax=Pseudoalteromonas haloplanktis TaxID=228 RepID=A0ABU1BBG0_PSEHA|nr:MULTISPECIES: ABC transporter permease [Pseudoalteromonas]MCF6143715.1 sodium transport system permease protein [Pseudoalteromonas mariniglutinosa NCIMB 1770]MDQ9091111.1 ABC transporter permease subunit [Pseudoalteromonas haloplanktis]TMN74825.1 transporter [Pseudoalteromonas sp. S1727]BDF93520.1 transporter [Pseudoalteromonas sp. KAN5]
MINLLKVLYKKEVMDASRDKRSIMAGLYYAIGAPIGMCLLMSVLLQQLASPEALNINIENSERAPGLIAHLNSQDIFASHDENERKAITLTISEDYQQKMSEGRPATVTLIADKSDDKLRKHITQVEKAIALYSSEIASLRLVSRGVDPSLMRAIALEVHDQATPDSKGGMILGIVVLTLILALFYAAMNLAIDTSAGERERNSLSLLLSHPLHSLHIVLAKIGAITTFSMLGLVVILVVSKFSYAMVPWQQMGFSITITPEFMLFSIAICLPIALMSASLQVFVSFMAKSFKEAQSYVTMVLFIPMALSMITTYDIATDKVQWLPIAAQQFALMEFIKGNPIPVPQLLLSTVITLVLFAAFSFLSARMLKSEKVVFGL